MELQFINKDTVVWVTPKNTLWINYALDRKNSEINLRTGFNYHQITIRDCDHFSLKEKNKALGYSATWLFAKKKPKDKQEN